MKKVKSSKKEKPSLYKTTLVIFGRRFIAEGETVGDALNKLTPGVARGKSILIIEKDDFKKERILQPFMTYRLFNSHGMTKQVAIKNITSLFI